MVLNFLKADRVPDKWNALDNLASIDKIESASHSRTQCIFKHSTRCSISQMAFNRINTALDEIRLRSDIYYVDVLRNRDVSNAIAKHWNIIHESPQILIIKNGEVVYHASHSDIIAEDTISHL